MGEHKANGERRAAAALSDEQEFIDWVVAISPMGTYVGKTSPDEPREHLLEAYALNRSLQVDRAGNAAVNTQLFPILLFPEVVDIWLPIGTIYIPFPQLHKMSKKDIYSQIHNVRQIVRGMKNAQDGVSIIMPGPNMPGKMPGPRG